MNDDNRELIKLQIVIFFSTKLSIEKRNDYAQRVLKKSDRGFSEKHITLPPQINGLEGMLWLSLFNQETGYLIEFFDNRVGLSWNKISDSSFNDLEIINELTKYLNSSIYDKKTIMRFGYIRNYLIKDIEYGNSLADSIFNANIRNKYQDFNLHINRVDTSGGILNDHNLNFRTEYTSIKYKTAESPDLTNDGYSLLSDINSVEDDDLDLEINELAETIDKVAQLNTFENIISDLSGNIDA